MFDVIDESSIIFELVDYFFFLRLIDHYCFTKLQSLRLDCDLGSKLKLGRSWCN